MEMLRICLLCFIGGTMATRNDTATILSGKCEGEDYFASTDDIRAMADAARERVFEELGGKTQMYLPKVYLQRQEEDVTLTFIKIKTRQGPPRDNTGRYIHLVLLDGGFLDLQTNKKRKDCFDNSTLSGPDTGPRNDAPQSQTGTVADRMTLVDCANVIPFRKYEMVRDDDHVKALMQKARDSYKELTKTEPEKWDFSVFFRMEERGRELYAVKIRVKPMTEGKEGFIHILIDSDGNVIYIEVGADGMSFFTKKQCINIQSRLSDAPDLGDETFAKDMTARCEQQYFKVTGGIWDNAKSLKQEIAADLGSPITNFQPRVYIEEGADIFMKIRVLGFVDSGPRYIHVHIDGAGQYIALEDGKHRKTCIEPF